MTLQLEMSLFLRGREWQLTQVQYWVIWSCLARGDRANAEELLFDWRKDLFRSVHKWVPGDHFYALDAKFNTLREAIQHIEDNGYHYKELVEKFVYKDGV